ncbi:hypothetical protein PybrP1_007648 [[Pythium] brassicae (nom. inval.)]|nr:hypothetical protein PybrP1_007648 [[Pythium] brassicae (nom. inval.)]
MSPTRSAARNTRRAALDCKKIATQRVDPRRAYAATYDATEKPDIAHFRVGAQVGEGNFSRIARATYAPTGEVFALKVVEKQRVRRLRLRHANVLNEIAMEKEEPTAASDLWAVGCILFQLLTGETPFSGGSAYLTFLKVQDGRFELPAYVSDSAADLITQLLQTDPARRIGIPDIKQHAFFHGVDFDNHMQAPVPGVKFQNTGLLSFAKQLEDAEKARDKALPLAFADSEAAQQRIAALSAPDRSLLLHLLKRKQLVHLPGIYPRFFASAALGRCRYATDRGYVGLTHDLQNEWADSFSFLVGRDSVATLEIASATREGTPEANKQKPAFVVICGDFVHAEPGQESFDAQVSAFQQLVSEIHPDTRLVFVPGRSSDSGKSGAASDAAFIEAYETSFGASHFSFWFGGMKFIVMNSTLLLHPEAFADRIKQQEDWLAKELENGKLCSRGTAVLAFHTLIDGAASSDKSVENNSEPARVPDGSISNERYLELVTGAKASLLITSHGTLDAAFDVVAATHDVSSKPGKASEGDDDTDGEEEARGEQRMCKVLCCKTPWSAASSGIHAVTVTHAGVQVKRCEFTFTQAPPGSSEPAGGDEGKAVPAPEDATLTLDSVEFDVPT